MSVEVHRRVEDLMEQAESLKREGRSDDAGRVYRQAAVLEEQAFHLIPLDRERTRGIIAASAVALYRDGSAPDEAARLAHQLLGLSDGVLTTAAQDELRALLDEIVRERRQASGSVKLALQSFDVSFEGAMAEAGYVPIGTVALKLQQLQNLLVRIGEWTSGEKFRETDAPSKSVARLILPMMSQPTFGSFRFQLRMGTPRQPWLPGLEPDGTQALPERVSNDFIEIVSTISLGEVAQLEERVPDNHYRGAFVRLVRNLAPDGREIERIHVQRTLGGDEQSADITATTGSLIRSRFPPPPPPADAEPVEVIGTLRALSLDRRYLRLLGDTGSVQCTFEPGVLLDDVVGPFVNHRVRALGYRRGSKIFISEVLEDPPPESPSGGEAKALSA